MIYPFYQPSFSLDWWHSFQPSILVKPELATYPGYEANLHEVLPLIEEAVKNKQNDELLYDYLIQHAPSQQDQEILAAICNDERKHRQMFKQMYITLTGTQLKSENPGHFQPPTNYLNGLERVILRESSVIELYRKIYFTIPGAFRNMVFEILTDEINHGMRYTFLYAKNK